jgi:methionyl-tRNA formyltransferase
MFKVGFLGRARLGLDVLEGLLANPNLHVPVIISCGATPEVEDTAARMEAIAAERGIDYFATNHINKPEWEERLASYGLDLAVAMLWLHTINDRIIGTARLGFINCHGGHLPKYRGNACANWAILNGEPYIGTSAHLMAPGILDNGPVILQDHVEIGPDSYIGDLIGALEEKGRRLVLESVERFRAGTATLTPQDEAHASYCYPRIPRDGEIDWHAPGEMIYRLVRAAGRPYPGAYSWFMDHRAGGTIRKLTIWRAHLEPHALNEFYAMPGHLLRLERGRKWAIVCGDRMLLVLDEIEVDGAQVEPSGYFKTVRQRMGLDHGLIAAENSRRLDRLESLGETAARFARSHGGEIEQIEAEVRRTVDDAAAKIAGCLLAEANPLRNYSFRKHFCDWEGRERWFGVQVYRSIRLEEANSESIAVGYWRISNEGGRIEKRIYAALGAERAERYGSRAEAAFAATVSAPTTIVRTSAGHVRGLFAEVAGDEDEVAETIAAIARTFDRLSSQDAAGGTAAQSE